MLRRDHIENKAYTSEDVTSNVSDDRTTPKPESQEGGQGEATLLSDPKRIRGDRKLLGRAIRAGWNIPEGMRDKAVRVVDSMLDSGDPMLSKEGVKLLTVMHGQNQADEHLEAKHERLDEGLPTDAVYIAAPPRVIGE